jgi:hypothetical protein
MATRKPRPVAMAEMAFAAYGKSFLNVQFCEAPV